MSTDPLNLHAEGRYRVMRALQQSGPTRRSELVRQTGLSRATVASLVSGLSEDGVVEERSGGERGMGRPASLVAISPTAAYAIGVDIAHHLVRVGICDLQGACVEESVDTLDVDRAPAATLKLVARRIDELLTRRVVPADAVIGVGLAVPAPVYSASGELAAEGILPGWVGVRPGERLAELCGLPVRMIHGADGGAMAEHLHGAGRHAQNLIYVRVSSGIGAGIIVGGQPLPQFTGFSSELGHIPVVESGIVCRCGNRGCLETVASMSAIARQLDAGTDKRTSGAELQARLQHGERGALRIVEDAAVLLGGPIAAAVTLLGPELVIVGGELAVAADALLDPIRSAIRRTALPAAADRVTVVAGALGERAETLGAASFVLSEYPRLLAERDAASAA